ncbi:MAG TPA: diaminopimelate epimerase [Syntrophales bacterium]|nr:diaminopimelate epimerase [Syntrophales bacterium]HPQ43350.1 diaminopimelate epimerase [Syntrophales bacterium]
MTENRHRFVEFSKMSGHGNDFIVIDNRSEDISTDWSERASVWCKRRTSVGADGLLIIEASTDADFRLRIFQTDGSEAEMCGNGARCAAAFAVKKGFAKSQMIMETMAGKVGASVQDEMVAIQLTDPSYPKDKDFVDIDGVHTPFYFINSGVPHTILFRNGVAEMPADDVAKTGRTVRFHPAFAPAGTNVDFVEIIERGRIRARTYERGVEEETLACGTGAVASAIISSRFEGAGEPPIHVEMPGGVLIVDFKEKDGAYKDVWLKGKVEFVYEGSVRL